MALVKLVFRDKSIDQVDAMRTLMGIFTPLPSLRSNELVPFTKQTEEYDLVEEAYILCDESIADELKHKIKSELNIDVNHIEDHYVEQNPLTSIL